MAWRREFQYWVGDLEFLECPAEEGLEGNVDVTDWLGGERVGFAVEALWFVFGAQPGQVGFDVA
jgi:hypothetical protein